MSSRPSGSRGGSVASNANQAALRATASNRFADRRQERMRGAGTAVAIQRDFQFKLPQKRPTAAPTPNPDASASTSNDSSLTKRKPGRPRGSGPKQKAAAAAAAAAAAEASFDAGSDLNAFSPPPLHDELLYSPHADASGSMGVGRRMARPRTSAPISSTPAPSRINKQTQHRTASSVAPSPRRGNDVYDDEELGSQIGDYSGSSADASAGGSAGGAGMVVSPPEWDGGMDGVDESLPMIPSPAASSHVDSSVRRMRPSIGGASASRLSIASHADSPAARAAQRNLDARQRHRQGSPGTQRISKQAPLATAAAAKARGGRPPSKSAAIPSRRALIQVPTEIEDETVMDRTMLERQRRAASISSARAARPGRELQKRLKRALSLVFSAEEAADPDDPDAPPPGKKRKSAKYLNDVDIIWSIVDEELRSAIEEQPAKAPFLALKALRKSVRSNFLNLSEKTDNRTTLISQLMRARKQKRLLRKEVFAKRSELAKVTVEAGERQKELDDWSKEVKDVRRCNAFLLNLQHQAAAWA
ncbi:hypothetical protein EX895_006585 [Sporisorium graminicola]|uniref:Uncharacterized protein n=1 Tax=Sporisorium graminicola TaxID=280036 RepID=A0A4U7KL83_9BASI|nr:hypothetical protein EX895_006585 [Sporisorium graminicola]TKY84683.1 hypothetical protein EX895_006585 [Sporisorium graminicola]